MASTNNGQDQIVGALAVGFVLGFGLLTVWEAIKQTRRSKNPRRSPYVFMIWGEILANVGILVLGFLFFEGVVGASVVTFFFILFLWVFEIQLLMQIIINRIAIIAETQRTINRLKWGTTIVISIINIAVFCIFIPAHLDPPVNQIYVEINEYWDRISKALICLVDAGLNWYFLKVVKQRLVDHLGMMKYKPLVTFNARLMVISVLLDVLLIGLMSLPNQEVFILFHPLVYMAKLNIEMTMASLIVKLARGSRADAYQHHPNSQHQSSTPHHGGNSGAAGERRSKYVDERDIGLKTFHESRIRSSISGGREGDENVPEGGIHQTRTFQVTIHHSSSGSTDEDMKRYDSGEDNVGLTANPGHPTGIHAL